MKKTIFLLYMMFLTLQSYSQDSGLLTDQPFGGGGGYLGTWMIPKLQDINNAIAGFGTPELTSSGFYSSGGAGFAYIGVVSRVRIGGVGLSGGTSVKSFANGFNREVKYSYGLGGVTLEYTLPVTRKFGISVGAMIGYGSITLEMYRNKGNVDWSNMTREFNDPLGTANSYGRTIQKGFFLFSPSLNVEIPINPLVCIRVGSGYNMAFGGSDWKVDNEQLLTNVPSINNNSYYFQAGILVGLFFF